jgi:hypothetical protein
MDVDMPEFEEVNVRTENVIFSEEEECIDTKDEVGIYSEEEEEEEEFMDSKEEEASEIKQEVSFEDTI